MKTTCECYCPFCSPQLFAEVCFLSLSLSLLLLSVCFFHITVWYSLWLPTLGYMHLPEMSLPVTHVLTWQSSLDRCTL